MKIFRSAIVVLAIAVASISSAVARDSFNIGINVGGYGYPQAHYYAGPPVVYYSAPPVVYYRSAPFVSFGYQDYGHHNHRYQSQRFDNRWGNNNRWGNDNRWNNGGHRGNNGHRGHGHHRGHR